MANGSVTDVAAKIPTNLGKFVLDPLNHAIAAGEREALKVGVPASDVIEMLLNHLASVVAMIEPAGVRAETIKDVIRAFPGLVTKHVDARHMSPGGVFMPNHTVPDAETIGG
jgi:hypothetical protein